MFITVGQKREREEDFFSIVAKTFPVLLGPSKFQLWTTLEIPQGNK